MLSACLICHNRYPPKRGEMVFAPFGGGGELGARLTMWPGPRSTSVPSGVLIHPAMATFGHNRHGPKIVEGLGHFLGGGGAGFPFNTMWPLAGVEAYLRAKFHLDPSNRLATIYQRYRQDRQTGQLFEGIGRTVLQTVVQNCFIIGVLRTKTRFASLCVCKAPFTRYSLLSNRIDNRLYRAYKHSTGCQTRLTTGLTTG